MRNSFSRSQLALKPLYKNFSSTDHVFQHLQAVINFNKMRIIALYIMSKNGISEENLNKLVTHAQLEPSDKQTLLNLANLGLNVVVDVYLIYIDIFMYFFACSMVFCWLCFVSNSLVINFPLNPIDVPKIQYSFKLSLQNV